METDALPATPAWTIAIASASTSATIRWAGVDGATSYRVYWSTQPNVTPATPTFFTVAGSDSDSQKYTQTGLATGATTYYIVTALSAAGEGAPTSVDSVTTGQADLAAPRNVRVTAMSGGTNVITADLVAGASSYVVYWSHTPGVTPANAYRTIPTLPPPTGVAAFRFNNNGQTPGATTYYIVAGVKNGQAGLPSDEVAVTNLP
jgi:hypothetical protein